MTIPATNLFGEQRIKIEGNPLLEGIANHILDLVKRQPELLNGKKIGEINRKITLALYFDDGLSLILKSGDRELFSQWFMAYHTEEEIARAVRYLAHADYIRLPVQAVQNAEQQRQRIARSVK